MSTIKAKLKSLLKQNKHYRLTQALPDNPYEDFGVLKYYHTSGLYVWVSNHFVWVSEHNKFEEAESTYAILNFWEQLTYTRKINKLKDKAKKDLARIKESKRKL